MDLMPSVRAVINQRMLHALVKPSITVPDTGEKQPAGRIGFWCTISEVAVHSVVLGPPGSRAMVRQNIVVGTCGRGFLLQGGPGIERDIEETGTRCPLLLMPGFFQPGLIS